MANKETIRRPDRKYVESKPVDIFFQQIEQQINEITTYIKFGNGTPENVLSANPGAIYANKTIASGEYAVYIKRTGTGSTGWEGVGTVLP